MLLGNPPARVVMRILVADPVPELLGPVVAGAAQVHGHFAGGAVLDVGLGLADPMALLTADAAARAVEFVGLPEAQLNLAHAVIHLATAPKSNRVTAALGAAQQDVKERPAGEVPMHLRSGGYYGAKKLGHGIGYEYPHDDPRGWVPQEHRPPEVACRV